MTGRVVAKRGSVALEQVTKRFGDVMALDDVSFHPFEGVVHAVLGENGAGKTTLMNILYGLERPSTGRMLVDGKLVSLKGPAEAQRLGIGMIHQHLSLVNSMSVTENVLLGLEGLPWRIDFARHARKIRELAASLEFEIDPARRVDRLTLGERQQVEILKLMYRDARLLIMDEPTSQLGPSEIESLSRVMRKLCQRGKTILFISHKLREVMEAADHVTVLRKGRLVWDSDIRDTTRDQLARLVSGVEATRVSAPATPLALTTAAAAQSPILSVSDLVVRGSEDQVAVNGVSLELFPGEILGIAGVSGNGQSELAEALAGLRVAERGSIKIEGRDVTSASVFCRRTDFRLGYTPAERNQVALLLNADVKTNAVLRDLNSPLFARYGILSRRAITDFAARLIQQFRIACRGPEQSVRFLSGGNQQRLVLGRELANLPRVLIVDNPCQGLDPGATQSVHEELRTHSATGLATLYISSEIDDLLAVCDRIGVLFRGQLVGILTRAEANREQLGRLMVGLASDHGEVQGCSA